MAIVLGDRPAVVEPAPAESRPRRRHECHGLGPAGPLGGDLLGEECPEYGRQAALPRILVEHHRPGQRPLELTERQRRREGPRAVPALGARQVAEGRSAARAGADSVYARQGLSAGVAQYRAGKLAAGAARGEEQFGEVLQQSHARAFRGRRRALPEREQLHERQRDR